MADPFTADGETLQGSYEHVRRTIEFAGQTFNGWNEVTGGGVKREGRVHVFGAGDEPRGRTDGKAVPQEMTLKLEIFTWQVLKALLQAEALALGDTSATAYQKIPFQIVDQYRGADITQPSKETTSTVKIDGDVPETTNDGAQFYQTLTVTPVGIPQETFGI